ncbi:hypothetical protein RMSM_01204 [Rhodopirellula maiorica SM1]|uniref:Uncharacterized protein n=1 Tax=Rhodopirellula maiorica SM1 TaxID=1265738 RepID=M5RRG3_9BACT|nr:hypothetical protein RMSM_01204 [Rhodopirellula maiorica SM1]
MRSIVAQPLVGQYSKGYGTRSIRESFATQAQCKNQVVHTSGGNVLR